MYTCMSMLFYVWHITILTKVVLQLQFLGCTSKNFGDDFLPIWDCWEVNTTGFNRYPGSKPGSVWEVGCHRTASAEPAFGGLKCDGGKFYQKGRNWSTNDGTTILTTVDTKLSIVRWLKIWPFPTRLPWCFLCVTEAWVAWLELKGCCRMGIPSGLAYGTVTKLTFKDTYTV